MEYGGGGGGRGGVQPPSSGGGARGANAGTDTTDAAWHKHEQMILMESRHKQQCKFQQSFLILIYTFIYKSFYIIQCIVYRARK